MKFKPVNVNFVQVRELLKTMLAAKSFEKTTSPAALTRCLRILAEEKDDALAPSKHMRLAQVRELPKTMLAAKSFEKTTSPAALTRWLRILAEELAERLAVDSAEHARRPRSLSVTYRCRENLSNLEATLSPMVPTYQYAGSPAAAVGHLQVPREPKKARSNPKAQGQKLTLPCLRKPYIEFAS